MPTGYTYGIIDGKINTFPQFAKICMKAFGACMHMRDEDMDKPYEPQTPSDYHVKAVSKAHQDLKDAMELSDEAIIASQNKSIEESKKYHLEAIEKAKKSKIILTEILNKAKAWTPPTPEHNAIKGFMIEQLTSTIRQDCESDYHDRKLIELSTRTINAKQIRQEYIESATHNIEYHSKERDKEIKRCEDSNKWVTEFIKSIE